MRCPVTISVNGRPYHQEVEPRLLLVHFLRECRPDRHQDRVRHEPVRSLHGAARRRRREVVHDPCGAGRWRERHHDRGAGGRRRAAPRCRTPSGRSTDCSAASARRGWCSPRTSCCARIPIAVARTDPARPRRQHVPLHRLSEHRARRAGGSADPRGRGGGDDDATGAPARVFGSGIRRREDPRLLTGTARYTEDFILPGHGARGDPAQPARPCAHHAASTRAARKRRPASSPCTRARHRRRAQSDSLRVAAAESELEGRAVSRRSPRTSCGTSATRSPSSSPRRRIRRTTRSS